MSPRSSKQNEAIRKQRIKQIMDAAREVYVEKGVQGTEMGEVAERAGVARGLVYYYFKEKMALFRQLFIESMQGSAQYTQEMLGNQEPPLKRLETYARFFLNTAVERPYIVKFYQNITRDLGVVFGEEAKDFERNFHLGMSVPLTETIQQAMDEGVFHKGDAELSTQYFFNSLFGMVYYIAMERQQEEKEELIKESFKLIFEGMLEK